MVYKKEELINLHECLYEILSEIRRVCSLLKIKFVMLGGSAIGVYYWRGIIPFDFLDRNEVKDETALHYIDRVKETMEQYNNTGC